jgi:hypothetical protein
LRRVAGADEADGIRHAFLEFHMRFAKVNPPAPEKLGKEAA